MELTPEQATALTIREIALNHYLPEKRARRRATTVYGYESAINLHILSKWGNMTVPEITRRDVQEWMDTFADNPGGGEKAFKTFRQVIRWAIDELGVMAIDPTKKIELPRKPMYKPQTLTQRRLKRLIRGFVGSPDEPTVIIQCALGTRPGECYQLDWKNINWRTGVVPIRGTLQQVCSHLYVYPTKTAKSERDCILPPWALDRLHQIWIERGRPKGRIIGEDKPSKVAYRIKRWIRAYKLPSICMKNLRHTWGTIAARNNPIETVSAMMGHSNIQTTYRYYYQLTIAATRKAQRKVARSILGKTCDDMYKGIELPAPAITLESLSMAA